MKQAAVEDTSGTTDTLPSAVIVVPCFNEADRLPVDAFRSRVASHPDIAFLFVDDGSSDRTHALLQSLGEACPALLRVLRLPANRGKAEAVRAGVEEAIRQGAAFVGYWDADLSTPLEEIDEFLRVLRADPEVLVVLGSRVRRLGAAVERDPLRHYAGRIFATAASLVLGLPVYDTQCGAKLLRVCPAVQAAFAEPFSSRWIFDVELLSRLAPSGSGASAARRFFEVPLRRWRDVPGSKLRPRHAFLAIGELWRIAQSRQARQ